MLHTRASLSPHARACTSLKKRAATGDVAATAATVATRGGEESCPAAAPVSTHKAEFQNLEQVQSADSEGGQTDDSESAAGDASAGTVAAPVATAATATRGSDEDAYRIGDIIDACDTEGTWSVAHYGSAHDQLSHENTTVRTAGVCCTLALPCPLTRVHARH